MTGQSAAGNAIFRRPGQAPKPGKWLSNNGSAMSFGTRLFTWLHGTYVGSDSAGNRYYRGRPIGARKRERRWVIYAGSRRLPGAGRMAWLAAWHPGRAADRSEAGALSLEKPHLPNLTGTPLAYRPPGHTLAGGRRARGDRRLSGLDA